MKCIKCKNVVERDEIFCRYCGHEIKRNMIHHRIKNGPSVDEELVAAYIGRDAHSIMNYYFSWCTFFLGAFYMLIYETHLESTAKCENLQYTLLDSLSFSDEK